MKNPQHKLDLLLTDTKVDKYVNKRMITKLTKYANIALNNKNNKNFDICMDRISYLERVDQMLLRDINLYNSFIERLANNSTSKDTLLSINHCLDDISIKNEDSIERLCNLKNERKREEYHDNFRKLVNTRFNPKYKNTVEDITRKIKNT